MIADGRRILISRAPLFAELIYRTTIVPDERVPTMGVTDKMLLVYSPKFLAGRNPRQVAALLWHEMMHIVTTFALRKELPSSVSNHMLNEAADLFINSQGRSEGWQLPPEGLFPEKYGFPDGLSTLEYLELLQSKKEEEGGSSDEHGSGESVPGCASGRCGIEGSLKEELEQAHASASQATASEAVGAMVRRAEELIDKSPGSVPGSLKRLLPFLAIPPSKVDWEEILRECVRTLVTSARGNLDQTYARPHRNAFVRDGDVLLPGEQGGTPEVMVAVDVSGSMDEGLLRRCLAEIVKLLDELDVDEVELVTADTCIQSRERVNRRRLATDFTLCGGGGTSFAYPIQQICADRPPSVLVYLTDGYGDFGAPPPFPVVWAIFTEVTPPFGHHVALKD